MDSGIYGHLLSKMGRGLVGLALTILLVGVLAGALLGGGVALLVLLAG